MRAGSYIIKRSLAAQELYNQNLYRFEDAETLVRWLDRRPIMYVIDKPIMIYNITFSELSKPNPERWNKDFGFYLPFKMRNYWRNCFLGMVLKLTFYSYPGMLFPLIKQYKCFVLYTVPFFYRALKSKFNRLIIKKILHEPINTSIPG
jgi:hypothetical protein